MQVLTQRATDDVLDASYEVLEKRVDSLLAAAGDVRTSYLGAPSPKELRAPKGHEGDGHPFMRPVVQVQVVKALRHVIEQKLLTWDDALSRLAQLDWKLAAAPFLAVWTETPEANSKGKMATGKDNATVLRTLLISHLAPTTKAEIDRAIKAYRNLKGKPYPYKVDDLTGHIIQPPTVVPEPTEAASEVPPPVTEPVVDEDDIADIEPGDAEDIEPGDPSVNADGQSGA